MSSAAKEYGVDGDILAGANICGFMKVAIDKNTNLKLDNKNEYIYVFKDEPLDDLLKLNIHCINYKELEYIDINLTDYDIDCIKKTKPSEKDWDKIPKAKDYKFAIYEITMTITPDSPEISQEEYDKEWEEHIKFRFGGYDDEEVDYGFTI